MTTLNERLRIYVLHGLCTADHMTLQDLITYADDELFNFI